jgi:hypothetical protein
MADAWTSATPLRNADFKALLATPRPPGATQQQQGGGAAGGFKHPRPKAAGGEGDGKKFKKPHPKGRAGKGGKDGKGGDDEDDDGPKYRCVLAGMLAGSAACAGLLHECMLRPHVAPTCC